MRINKLRGWRKGEEKNRRVKRKNEKKNRRTNTKE